ncbi:DUF1499 domain-containing protein [bacterium]|nr:DUF1499 domain-containing protein [bacterium]
MKIISIAGQAALLVLCVVALVCELDLIQFKFKTIVVVAVILSSALVALIGSAALLIRYCHNENVPADLIVLMMVCICPMLLTLYSLGLEGIGAPNLHDISTDMENPPALVYAQMTRSEYEGTSVYPIEHVVQQLAAYPDIKSLPVAVSARDAFRLSMYVSSLLGWSIVSENVAIGQIDLRSKTRFIGFKTNIAIRITPIDTSNSLIDVRSATLNAERDFALNASRIRAFFAGFNAELRKRQMH